MTIHEGTARPADKKADANQLCSDCTRTRLYLVRHGELTTSHEWRYVGQKMDVDLSEMGIRQIRMLSGRLRKENLHVILSSDLKRTRHSAQIIGDACGGISPIACREFREIHLGHWEGLTLDEIAQQYEGELQERMENIGGFRIEGGESFTDVQRRVMPKLYSCMRNNKGKNVLVVAHGGVNRVVLSSVLGLELNAVNRIEQSYACLNIIDFYDDGPVIQLVNETVQC